MNPSYVPALAALTGSAVGALASFGSAWLTQSAQERSNRLMQSANRKEQIYGQFIDEAANVFGNALVNDLGDVSQLVRLYALNGKLRLFAAVDVIREADDVMRRIMIAYQEPQKDAHFWMKHAEQHDVDVLRAFTEACRKDLAS